MARTTSFQADRRHRWKVLGIGVAANASFSAAFQGIPTTAVFMRSGYHLDNVQLGLVIGLLGLGIAISELPWGLLTDVWGDRRVLLVGLGFTAVALGIMATLVSPTSTFVPSVWHLAVGLSVLGLLGGSVNGSSGRAVMTWFHDSERGFAMSIRQTAVPLGGAIGAALLPATAMHYGFFAVFGVLALLCAVTTFFAWLWLYEPVEETQRAGVTHVVPSLAHAKGRGPLSDSTVWRFVLGLGIFCAPQFAILTFSTVFLHDFLHIGVAAISASLLTIQIGAMVARVWSGRWTDRRRNRRGYLRACSILTTIAFFVLAGLVASHSFAHEAFASAVVVTMLIAAGILVSAWHGVAYTELATQAGAGRAGTALGLGNTCAFFFMFITPVAIPGILAFGSWPLVWVASGLCALMAHFLFPRSQPELGVEKSRKLA